MAERTQLDLVGKGLQCKGKKTYLILQVEPVNLPVSFLEENASGYREPSRFQENQNPPA